MADTRLGLGAFVGMLRMHGGVSPRHVVDMQRSFGLTNAHLERWHLFEIVGLMMNGVGIPSNVGIGIQVV
jgi:hypothetical protein